MAGLALSLRTPSLPVVGRDVYPSRLQLYHLTPGQRYTTTVEDIVPTSLRL